MTFCFLSLYNSENQCYRHLKDTISSDLILLYIQYFCYTQKMIRGTKTDYLFDEINTTKLVENSYKYRWSNSIVGFVLFVQNMCACKLANWSRGHLESSCFNYDYCYIITEWFFVINHFSLITLVYKNKFLVWGKNGDWCFLLIYRFFFVNL